MRVEVSEDVQARMRSHLRRAGAREIGGVLMGEQITPGHFRIVDLTVDDQTGSAAHFVRDPALHRAALDAFFARNDADFQRFNYLGEWHSHPQFSIKPSSQDCRSMMSLVEGERDIHFAVLVIARLRYWVQLECSATLFERGFREQSIQLVTRSIRWI